MEITLVLLIAGLAVLLFITEKFSMDVVALLVLGALLVTGLVTPEEGLSGFSNPATVAVGAMFVLSAGLNKTGALAALGRVLVQKGHNETWLLLLVMATTGALSPFMNNTAVVAVFLPLVINAAMVRKISSSKLLIPLSFASQFGGVCTLMGTSTNLLVNAIAERSGGGGFSMFEFAKLGWLLFVTGILYFLFVGRWLLPARQSSQLTENYQLGEYVTELRVMPNSPLIGKSVLDLKLGATHDVTLLEIIRGERKLWSPARELLRQGDLLLVRGAVKQLMDLRNSARLEIEPQFKLQDEQLEAPDLDLTEVLLAPQSRLAGRTLKGLDFRGRYHAIVLALHRRGQVLREQLAAVRLRFGDALLLLGPKADINRLRDDDNFIVLEPRQDVTPHRGKAPLALGIVALVVMLAAFRVMPIVVSALLGCAALVLTRCLRTDDAYRAIDWKVMVLLAGLIPLGLAMEKTGAAQTMVDATMSLVGPAGPTVMLGVIYLLTAVLTAFLSNNAAAVLLAPVAILTATKLGVDPKPFLVAVTFAASTCFATPVGYQTNTMVYNVGGYTFWDFLKVGVPLNLLFGALTVFLIPKFWPF